jgi:hypothetical protein
MGWPVISSVRQVCIEGEPVTRGLGVEGAKSARLSSGVVAAVKASAKDEKTAERQWIARIQDYALISGETKSAHCGTLQPSRTNVRNTNIGSGTMPRMRRLSWANPGEVAGEDSAGT